MTEQKVCAVIALVAQALNMEEDELGPDSSMSNVLAWDSVEQLNICLAFEQRFGKHLDMDAIASAISVQALAALVP
jgi:acyl carrier protein